jgi:hypothetical protein
LVDAANAFGKVAALVRTDLTIAQLDKFIGDSKDKDAVWMKKRVRFRLQTKERYRQILLDLAREEWLDEQVSYRKTSHKIGG